MRSCAALFSAGLVVLGVAGTAACGLTADFSGLQGGTLPDASLASGSDAALAPDAGAPADATPDGTIDAGGSDAAPGFCASLATPVKLCTDFDEGQPVDAGWGATDLYGGQAINLTAMAFSPPSAFQSAVNPSGAPASARLLQALPTASPHVRLEFEMLLAPSDGTFELAVIHEVIGDGTTYGLFYREVGSALQVELLNLAGDGSVFDQTWPIGAPSSTWSHVVIDLEVADAGSFTVQQDGQVVVTQTNVPTSTPTRTALFVELGFYSFEPGSGEASFDNAIVDWP